MDKIIKQRMTCPNDKPLVVFLVGMRINKFWKIHKWWPVAMAMPKMLQELSEKPDSGYLGGEQWMGRTSIMVQYWESFEKLEMYARDREGKHFPAWVEFNKKVKSSGDVGIWHETFKVSEGAYESIYHNMPSFGLGKVNGLIPATGKYENAKGRIV